MSTAYRTTAEDSPDDVPCLFWVFVSILIAFLGVPVYVAWTTPGEFYKATSKDPTFTVVSTEVKAYNLTSDDRLLSHINIAVRIHNPINSGSFLVFYGGAAEVTNSRHGLTAQYALRDFGLSQGEDALLHVEAVGLTQVPLDRMSAEEVRADVDAGEQRVRVGMNLTVWGPGRLKAHGWKVKCKDVAIDFNRPTEMVQRVDCDGSRQYY